MMFDLFSPSELVLFEIASATSNQEGSREHNRLFVEARQEKVSQILYVEGRALRGVQTLWP